jgi:lipoprotein-releasing system ATP-binding protein
MIPVAEDNLLEVRRLTKSYQRSGIELPVLRGVDLTVARGKVTALVGRSGSGKSTLLHLIAALDRPDGGEILFDGKRVDQATTRQRDVIRNRQIGMIFQFYHLLPELTALENVLTPSLIGRSVLGYFRDRRSLRKRATELLESMGLAERMNHTPRELSGGEMQRTAIARALMGEPSVLFADEPTGNLDAETGQSILKLLYQLNKDNGLTMVIVTHDESIAADADHCVRLQEGRIVPNIVPRRRAG